MFVYLKRAGGCKRGKDSHKMQWLPVAYFDKLWKELQYFPVLLIRLP